jgi:hypothetical protein
MRQDHINKSNKLFDGGLLEYAPRANPARSGMMDPAQMHDLLTNYQTLARKTLGTESDLGIEVAENLGPIPRDYANLLVEILHECVKYIGRRSNGPPTVEVRLFETRKHAQLSFVTLEVGNRNSEQPVPRKFSEDLLQLRERTEQWNGFLVIDGASHDKTVFRIALPIVSFCS